MALLRPLPGLHAPLSTHPRVLQKAFPSPHPRAPRHPLLLRLTGSRLPDPSSHNPRRPLRPPVRGRSRICLCPPPCALRSRADPPLLASPQRSALGARPGGPVLPMPGAGAGGARLGSPRAPAPQLQPRSPQGLGPLLCVSFGHGGAEVTEVAGEGGGREGVLGRGRRGGSRHLCAGRGGGS